MNIAAKSLSLIQKRPIATIVTINLVNGFSSVLFGLGASKFNPLFFMGASNFILALLLMPGAGGIKRLITYRKGRPFIISNFLVLIVDATFIFGIFYTGVSTMSLIALLKPVLIYIGGIWLLHEIAERRGVIGAIIAVIGALIFVLGSTTNNETSETIGVLLLITSVAVGAAMILYSKHLRADFSGRQILIMRNLPMGFLMVLAGFIFDPSLTTNTYDWIVLGATGITGAVLSGLFFTTIAYAPISKVADLSYLTRITGLLAAVVILGERPSPVVLAGGFVVLMGLLIAHPIHWHRYHFHSRHHFHWKDRFKHGAFKQK